MKRKDLILNPYFIIGLFVLLLNDFYLKAAYGNFVTGKLSDFAGLLIFPMFIAAVFPKLKKQAALITGIGFVIWKLPLFTPVVDLLNQLPLVSIHRVIDYSDYVALLILPVSHYLITAKFCRNVSASLDMTPVFERLLYVSRLALLGVSFFAFCATSYIPKYIYQMPKGTVYVGESYNIKLPKDSVISAIERLGYNCEYHDEFVYCSPGITSDTTKKQKRGYYQTDNIIRYFQGVNRKDTIAQDTIANVKYDLLEINPNKTRLTIINVTLPEEGQVQDWKQLKVLSRQYKDWLKKNMIEKVKDDK